MERVYGFTGEMAREVQDLVRRDRGRGPAPAVRRRQPDPGSFPLISVLKVTSLTLTSGYYPCQWQSYDVDATTFANGSTDTGWVRGLNGEALRLNHYYGGRLQGLRTSDSKPAYLAIGAARPFPAKLTSSAGAAYAWTEQVEAAGGTFTNGTRTGTTGLNPAYELNAKQNLDLLSPAPVVWLWPGFLNAGGADQEYLFSYHSLNTFLTGGTVRPSVTRLEWNSATSANADPNVDWEDDGATAGLEKIRHNGLTGTITVLDDVVCDGGALSVYARDETYHNGLLKSRSDQYLLHN